MVSLLPVRLLVAILLFFGSFVAYMLRVNLSVAILAFEELHKRGVSSLDKDPDCRATARSFFSPRAALNDTEELDANQLYAGTILSSFNWLYWFSTLMAKGLAEKYGISLIVGVSAIMAASCTIASGYIFTYGFWAIIGMRVLTGFFTGFIVPLLHILIIQWSPMNERAMFGSTLYGTSFGISTTFVAGALILNYSDWDVIMYVTGGIALFWAIVWLICVSDSPTRHPWISDQEREHIQFRRTSLSVHQRRRRKVPWNNVISSKPFRALFVLLWANSWNLYFYITYIPTFLYHHLHFPVIYACLLSTSPVIARTIIGVLCNYFSTYFVLSGTLTVGATRKWFTVFSHILPGTIQLALMSIDCDQNVQTLKIIVVLGLNGAVVGGGLVNCSDLSPQFAEGISSVLQAFLCSASIAMPFAVGYVLYDFTGYNVRGWSVVFVVNSVILIVSGIAFLLFGSGSAQPWDITSLMTSIHSSIGPRNDESSDSDMSLTPRGKGRGPFGQGRPVKLR